MKKKLFSKTTASLLSVLLISACSTAPTSTNSTSGGESVDCRNLYGQGVIGGGAAGLVIASLLDVQHLPLLFIGVIAGAGVAEDSCDKLIRANETKNQLTQLRTMLASQLASLQSNTRKIERETAELRSLVLRRKINAANQITLLRPIVDKELLAIGNTKRKAEQIRGQMANNDAIKEMDRFLSALDQTQIRLVAMQHELARLA